MSLFNLFTKINSVYFKVLGMILFIEGTLKIIRHEVLLRFSIFWWSQSINKKLIYREKKRNESILNRNLRILILSWLVKIKLRITYLLFVGKTILKLLKMNFLVLILKTYDILDKAENDIVKDHERFHKILYSC